MLLALALIVLPVDSLGTLVPYAPAGSASRPRLLTPPRMVATSQESTMIQIQGDASQEVPVLPEITPLGKAVTFVHFFCAIFGSAILLYPAMVGAIFYSYAFDN